MNKLKDFGFKLKYNILQSQPIDKIWFFLNIDPLAVLELIFMDGDWFFAVKIKMRIKV